tara:strand:+ start:1513 stop:1920 length:408 start_codon:yes stop_codon:yes gene_type:complete
MEDKEHLKFIEEVAKISNETAKKIVPVLANEHNPEYVRATKGTPLENMTSDDRTNMISKMTTLYSNRYQAFADAWVNLFGDSKATPFKQSPKVVLEEFMRDAMNAKKLAFKNDYAVDWLKKKYSSEMGFKKRRKI